MKNNRWILSLTLGTVLLSGLVTCSMYRTQALTHQLQAHSLITKMLTYQETGSTLTGKSLVLYQVVHSDYPDLTVQRVQMTDQSDTFQMSLQGIHGSLVRTFQNKYPSSFAYKMTDYIPASDLLNQPLLTLLLMGYDQIHLDLFIEAVKSTPNQILFHLTVQDQGRVMAIFTSKMPVRIPQLSVWENIRQSDIPVFLTYLDSSFQQRLDAYTYSKQLPLVTDKQQFSLSLFKKKN